MIKKHANIPVPENENENEDEDENENKKDISPDIPYSINNIPMLIIYLYKHYDEISTTINGLKFILSHSQTGDGCILLVKYNITTILFKIIQHDVYRNEREIQLLCLNILRQLLECNYTRDSLIHSTYILNITFSLGKIS